MTMKSLALGVVVAAAAFAAPVEAQIWNKGDIVVRSDERVVSRSGQRTIDGVSCVNVQVDRRGSRRTEQVCDWDRDGVYGDSDDRRIEERRRQQGQGVYMGNAGGRNRGQARAAEVHARNEARKREKALDKREKELRKREQELERKRREDERRRQARRW